ncbi:hypothetical protein HOV44_gp048 [Rheinheimera phage Barba5S]|jgi:hypothetical protein|uniref:Uncharacterized protein n=3 Tax=Barbavirus TaxID=2733095 RepID=A0A4V1EZQ9_9CAUD|nr:hypothetical protein HOV44_gp048 [Rheinheimera phage Barba5S]QCQ59126.1 hypothetical protein Barba5S_gp048 [Rheinheimera phage Barba5S]QCQ61055.1 hypothetical protein Barba15A_gp046 [Rheinheimera phage vB_RspM_Barba15A]QCQ62445.1 hypothetical protein Barba21S_gp045 [Rheinheimera phage vB_RspM_Barba21S]
MIDYTAYLKHRHTIVCQYIIGNSDQLPASLKISSAMGATSIRTKNGKMQDHYENVLEGLADDLLNAIQYPLNTFNSGDQAFQMFRLLPFKVYKMCWSEVVKLCIKELEK